MDIKFNVSAKTARLIGRENITDVDGAVIELVKNAYDADASCCFIKFDIPFPNINISYKKSLLKSFLKQDEYKLLLKYCIEYDDVVAKKKDLTIEQELELEKILFAHNAIIIADNGQGMSKSILETAWMNIGTNNKEKDFFIYSVEVGIKKPIPVELDKVFNFLQYAGLLMYARELSRGENGRYAIYIINYGFLIEKNVFGGRTNIKNVELATALKTRNMHE